MGEVKNIFRPEFLNRVDEIIVFHALTEDEINRIAKMLVSQVCKRLAERGIELAVDDEALRKISEAGCDLQYGARPLRRAIQRMIEDALSEEILLGNVSMGNRVLATVKDGQMAFETIGAIESGEAELLPAGQPNSD